MLGAYALRLEKDFIKQRFKALRRVPPRAIRFAFSGPVAELIGGKIFLFATLVA